MEGGGVRVRRKQYLTLAGDHTWFNDEDSIPLQPTSGIDDFHDEPLSPPGYANEHSILEENAHAVVQQYAVASGSWFMPTMLLDRSLLTMCLAVVVAAIGVDIVFFVHLKDWANLLATSKYSTSIEYGARGDCDKLESNSAALHFFINAFATIVLGVSNTFQQMATSLTPRDIKHALKHTGDVPIGTNSPFSIRHKRFGKYKSYSSWIFLIMTSLPIHLVANSWVGVSFSSKPVPVTFKEYNATGGATFEYNDLSDSSCWLAAMTGNFSVWDVIVFTEKSSGYGYSPASGDFATEVTVYYPEGNCTNVINTINVDEAINRFKSNPYDDNLKHPCGGTGEDAPFGCTVTSATKQCSSTIRMSASLILTICLSSKAVYMIVVLRRSRGRRKVACLSFGDLIASAIIEPDLQVRNECLSNADSIHRRQVAHTCHKHCKDPTRCDHGDGLGHCQKCKKFNKTNHNAGLETPIFAIKYKKALITTLGGASVVQMLILMFVSMAMLGVSGFSASTAISAKIDYDACLREREKNIHRDCESGKNYLNSFVQSGIGGMSSSLLVASLPADQFSSEIGAIMISNGAQLIYSLLYLLLIYNITLISMEHEWGSLEKKYVKLRATMVTGDGFSQSYFLQIPKEVLIPVMIFSTIMHWLLGQAIATREHSYTALDGSVHTTYDVVYAPFTLYAATVLMVVMTIFCWWAYFYKREGFIPTMYGSARRCCSAVVGLTEVRSNGLKWGDRPPLKGSGFRHANLSSDKVEAIHPGELYT